jgi:hypothetical protein
LVRPGMKPTFCISPVSPPSFLRAYEMVTSGLVPVAQKNLRRGQARVDATLPRGGFSFRSHPHIRALGTVPGPESRNKKGADVAFVTALRHAAHRC